MRVQVSLQSLKFQKLVSFRQFQNEDSIDAFTLNDKQLTLNNRLLHMKCRQKSCEMSVSAKYPVSKSTRNKNSKLAPCLTAFLCLMKYYLAEDSTQDSAP